MQDSPTAAQLVEAVREFLERDVSSALEGRVAFHLRVALNVLAIVQRELELGAELDDAERARLVALLGHDGSTTRELETELARAIRDGSLDAHHDEVMAHVRATVRGKLLVANPKYLDG